MYDKTVTMIKDNEIGFEISPIEAGGKSSFRLFKTQKIRVVGRGYVMKDEERRILIGVHDTPEQAQEHIHENYGRQ
jgi:hypothetical protein